MQPFVLIIGFDFSGMSPCIGSFSFFVRRHESTMVIRGALHAKTLSNLEEVKARNGTIITVGTAGDHALAKLSDVFLPIPDAPEIVQPLLAVVPLQLLAYHVALLRGCDIDKPRNLAKSVTVE